MLSGVFNAGLLADEMAIYLARNARLVQKPQLDDAEMIEVVKVPLGKLAAYVEQNYQTMKIDVKILGILPLLTNKL